jgi:anhydro-N-acetylmuramic acid kinase
MQEAALDEGAEQERASFGHIDQDRAVAEGGSLYHAAGPGRRGAAMTVRRVIGLMSGTSLDGVDAAWLETDGLARTTAGPSLTLPYAPAFRARLRAVLGGGAAPPEIRAVERDLTGLHAEAVERLRAREGLAAPDLVGFHGHTILHRPDERRTWQIGDGAALSGRLGVPVVSDFRSADVASGGQGAPLVPVFHRALAAGLERPLAVLNIGGVANVTWIGPGEDDLLAFDTGPGNALIDDWALRHTGEPVDTGGALAARGSADRRTVERFLEHGYFARRPPKSLDRDAFGAALPDHLGAEDGAATLVEITARCVALAADHFPAPARRWLVAGGGRHNPVLMAALARVLGQPVGAVESVGWDGDALEAQAFAYLAVRSVLGLPQTFPGTTGVARPLAGGRLDRP